MPRPFETAVLTDAGARLLTRSLAGEITVEFTKMAVGNGEYDTAEKSANKLQKRTDLLSQKNSYPFSDISVHDEHSVKLTSLISNQDPATKEVLVDEGYYINEIGIFAKENGNPDAAEVLYCISITSGDRGDYMPAYNGHSPAQITQDFYATVGNSGEVTIHSAGAVLLRDGDAKDATVTFSEAENRENIRAGEKLSVIFGKISKFFSDLKKVAFSGSYNDLEDKPTASDFDLGNVDNTSDLDKPVSTAQQKALDSHNTSSVAHTDIRDLIVELATRLNAVANSDDITLDQLSEIVAYIKSNRTLIETITTNKVNVADIVDSVTSTATNKPLSAKQGKVLNDLITDTKKSVSDGKSAVASAITSAGVSTASDATFDTMTNNINNIITGNADASNVLSGKTFSSKTAGRNTSGTMENNGAISKELSAGGSYTVPAGYHNGSGKITAKSLTSQTGVDSGKSAAGASQILTGYQAWVNGNKISGTMEKFQELYFFGNIRKPAQGYYDYKWAYLISDDFVIKSRGVGTERMAFDNGGYVDLFVKYGMIYVGNSSFYVDLGPGRYRLLVSTVEFSSDNTNDCFYEIGLSTSNSANPEIRYKVSGNSAKDNNYHVNSVDFAVTSGGTTRFYIGMRFSVGGNSSVNVETKLSINQFDILKIV